MTDGAVIEIVERRPVDAPDNWHAGGPVVPNEVRINGQRLFTSAGQPITVHQIDLNDASVAQVTLTLMARRVVIGFDGDDGGEVTRG